MLWAAGSLVHPDVPCILFTPLNPHSLSFRPLIRPQVAPSPPCPSLPPLALSIICEAAPMGAEERQAMGREGRKQMRRPDAASAHAAHPKQISAHFSQLQPQEDAIGVASSALTALSSAPSLPPFPVPTSHPTCPPSLRPVSRMWY